MPSAGRPDEERRLRRHERCVGLRVVLREVDHALPQRDGIEIGIALNEAASLRHVHEAGARLVSKACSRPSSAPTTRKPASAVPFSKRGWIIGQRHRDQRGILRRYAIGFEHLERWNAGSAAGRPDQDALALELREPVDLFRAAIENPNRLGYQAAHRMQVGRVDAVGEAALHEARLDIGVRVLEEPKIVHGRRGLPHLDLDAFFCRLFLDAERQLIIGAGLARPWKSRSGPAARALQKRSVNQKAPTHSTNSESFT